MNIPRVTDAGRPLALTVESLHGECEQDDTCAYTYRHTYIHTARSFVLAWAIRTNRILLPFRGAGKESANEPMVGCFFPNGTCTRMQTHIHTYIHGERNKQRGSQWCVNARSQHTTPSNNECATPSSLMRATHLHTNWKLFGTKSFRTGHQLWRVPALQGYHKDRFWHRRTYIINAGRQAT